MSAIITKFVIEYKLINEISIEKLSHYALEILNLLGNDRKKRC